VCYIRRFHFEKYPIDMALRYLLALEHLPPESQQIDRVVHAFALRYSECNGEAVSFDEAYIIAFSLLILHTAIFNRHAHVLHR